MKNDVILIASRYPLIADWLESHCQQFGWKTTRDQQQSDLLFSLVNISTKKDLETLNQIETKGIPIVVHTQQDPSKLLRVLYEHEPKGVIHMSSSTDSIRLTLESVSENQEYFDERVLTFILSKKYNDIYESISSLSNRELEIVDGIMDEMSNDEIAEKFDLSVRTVNAHKRNILQKMKARSLVGVAKMMINFTLRYS